MPINQVSTLDVWKIEFEAQKDLEDIIQIKNRTPIPIKSTARETLKMELESL